LICFLSKRVWKVLALLPDSLDSLDSLVRVEKEVVCSGCANWLFGAGPYGEMHFS
jgi:hypothetical protein